MADIDNTSEDDLADQQNTPPLSRTPDPAPKIDVGNTDTVDTSDPGDDAPDGDQPDKDGQPPADGKSKYVPHAKFNEVLQGKRELQARHDRLEQRTNQLLSILQQTTGRGAEQEQAPAEPQMPGDDDPMGQLKYLKDREVDRVRTDRERQTNQTQQKQVEEYYRGVAHTAKQDLAAEVDTDPAFREQYQFVVNSRLRELMATSDMSHAEAEARVQAEEVQGYAQAMQAGRRPADVIRRLANARGYVPKAPEQQQRTEITQERRDQHRSLSQMGGREGPSAMTARDLAKMDEDEFAKLSDSVIKGVMKKSA